MLKKLLTKFSRALCLLAVLLPPAPGSDGASPTAAPLRPQPNQVIVRFKDNVGPARREMVAERHGLRSYQPKGTGRIQAFGQQPSKPQLLEAQEGKDAEELSQQLSKLPEVLYAEPNYSIELARISPVSRMLPSRPNDFDFGRLWGMENTSKPGADIRALEAWARHTGSSNVIVAVIDTGIDFLHPDLAGNIWVNPAEIAGNGLDDDGNGFIDDVNGFDFISHDSDGFDDHGHGTHVSGTIGAVGNNSIGVAGVCWEVRLMALKAFDETGNGNVFSAIEAIEFAVAKGARVINASWGLKESSRALREAVAAAVEAGVVFVAAAGNDRTHAPFYPAAFDGVVSVGATTEQDERASFTNFGETLDVSAPGASIYSTLPDAAYGFQGGTSMAAPHVSGLAALILSAHPEFTAAEAEGIILNTADEFETTQPMGVGRINAGRAMSIEAPLPVARLDVPGTVSDLLLVQGSAHGNDFREFTIEIGRGAKPTNWVLIAHAGSPVTNGVLAPSFDIKNLPDGEHVLRLTALNSKGQAAVARKKLMLENVQITAPLSSDALRAGETISIAGRVLGQSRRYEVYWAEGLHAGEWKTNGITVLEEGGPGELARWDTSETPPNRFYNLKLVATSEAGVVDEEIVHMLYLDGLLRPGFPARFHHELLPQDEWRSLKAADLDADGKQEIIFVNPGVEGVRAAQLVVLDHAGQLKWSRELELDPPYVDEPVVGDVDGDGFLEIFAGGGRQVFGFAHDGVPLPGWPVRLRGEKGGKALADLDGDGALELIVQTEDWSSSFGAGVLKVYGADGTPRWEWAFGAAAKPSNSTTLAPAVGNMDNDPELEIVVVTGGAHVSLFDIRTPGFPVWSSMAIDRITSAPSLGDLDGDGRLDIVVGRTGELRDNRELNAGGLYAFDRSGRLLPGWPSAVEEYFPHSAALADMNQDGLAEVVAASFPRGRLHVLRANGFEAAGWPRELIPTGSGNVMPSIGDVNGDGKPDVVIAQPGYWLGAIYGNNPLEVAGVQAWSFDGAQIDLNPGPLTGLPFENSAQPWHKAVPPLLADLDGNGRIELVTASLVERTYRPLGFPSQRKDRGSIYVWELDAPFTTAPWPMHHQNARQSAALPPFLRANTPPILTPMPAQKVVLGAAFAPLPLPAFSADATDPLDRLAWSAQSDSLQVRVTASNELDVTAPTGWVGEEFVTVKVRDPHGAEATARVVYSAVLTGPSITLPPLGFEGLEDEELEIKLPLPEGLELALAGRPAHGVTEAVSGNQVRLTPGRNFFGEDEFLVVVRDPLGFTAFGRAQVTFAGVNDPPTPFADQVVTDEDTAVWIEPLANDRDPELDAISLVGLVQPQNGSALMQGSRILYTPATNFFGIDHFSYTARDGAGLVAEANISVSIRPVNDAPSLTNQLFKVRRNSRLNFEFPGVDPEGDRLRYNVTKPPQHGDLWMQPTLADYYPVKGFVGMDSFTYVASDGGAVSAPATVTIEIVAENNPPKPDAITIGARANKAVQIVLTASDEDEDPLTFEVASQPLNGVVSGTPPNIQYEPNPGFTGTNTFEYAALDPHGGRGTAKVTVVVKTGNTAPYALFSQFSLKMNSSTNFVLNSHDDEGDALEFFILTEPLNGSLSGVPPNLVYTPMPNYLGPDRFTFGVSDGLLTNQFPGEVYITVLSTNLPPESVDQATAVAPSGIVTASLDVTDPEGDAIRCVILKGPKHGVLSLNGANFTYRASTAFSGSDSFTYRAWDGFRYGNVATVRVGLATEGPPLPLAFLPIDLVAGNEMVLRFTAPLGRTVRLESSADFARWEVIHAQTSFGTNLFPVSITSEERRYFRLQSD